MRVGVNTEKTRYMVVGEKGHDLITNTGTRKLTNKYNYLGILFTDDGEDSQIMD